MVKKRTDLPQTTDKLLVFDLETTGVDHKTHGIWQLAGRIIVDGAVKEEFDYKMRPVAGKRPSKKAIIMARKGLFTEPEQADRKSESHCIAADGTHLVTDKQVYDAVLAEMNGFEDPTSVYWKFLGLLNKYVDNYDPMDKFTVVGFNSGFDVTFFDQFFKDMGATCSNMADNEEATADQLREELRRVGAEFDSASIGATSNTEFLYQFFKDQKNPYLGSYIWFPDIGVDRLVQWYFAVTKQQRPRYMKLGTICHHFELADEDDERWHDAKFDIEMTWTLFLYITKLIEEHHGK